jgi:dihydrolipoamide dehydrogenase
MAERFGLVVLGGGTGGYVAAIRAAQLGLTVAVVEQDKLGGTCLHRGCIPTKALLHTAELLHTLRHGADFGLAAGEVSLDYRRAMERKQRVVDQLHRGVQYLMKKNRITVFAGTGRMRGPGVVEVTSAEGVRTVEGEHLLLATGSLPRALPGLPFDGRRILSSDHILELERPPQRLLIVGGGAIGVEFASMYNDFGAEVTLVEMLPHLLPQDEADIAQELTRLFARRGIRVFTGAQLDPRQVAVGEAGVKAMVRDAQGQEHTVEADALLVAIGRQAAVEGAGLDQQGLAFDRGFVKVDQFYRTNLPGVYAIGDLIGGYLLAHAAAHEGMVAVEHMAGRDPEPLNPQRIPRVTYSRPEVASLGLTQAEAEQQGYRVKVGTFPFRANGRSLILGDAEGMVKVVADQATDDLLGVHIVGPEAGNLINEMALAKFLEATAWEVGESVHAHPTVSEVLHEAGLAVDGHAIHI